MRVHFIAIGGSVMHNLALALHKKGYTVSGSDDEIFEPAYSRLKSAGLLPEHIGWDESRITEDMDALVLGMHAKPDNPELLKAKSLGLKIYSFPEYIYEQSKDKKRIVIGGSHGKTSITAMILHVLRYCNRDFDYMVGAQLEGFDLMVHLSESAPVIILEGDEYPDSAINKIPKFHLYKPDVALISGIAWDHINVFPTFDIYKEQFRKFAELIPNNGALVYNAEDENVNAIGKEFKNRTRCIPYHTPSYSVREGICYLSVNGKDIPLQIFGKHNLQNLAGAKLICNEAGVTDKEFYEAIPSFKGAAKRLELLGKNSSVAVFKDFAHSPSKLKATIAAVIEQFPNRKLVAVMELHTYSSLNKNFLEEYHGCMSAADVKVVYFSTHALELKRLEKLNVDDVKKYFGDTGINVFGHKEALNNFLHDQEWRNANLLLMSSGNFDGMDLNSLVTFVLSSTLKPTE